MIVYGVGWCVCCGVGIGDLYVSDMLCVVVCFYG